jgi:transmembrane sensor
MSRSDLDEVLQQAAEWIVRAEEKDFSADDAVQLRAWLAADSRHSASYCELKALWADIPLAMTAGGTSACAANDDPEPCGPGLLSAWWRQMAAGAVAASLVAAIWLILAPMKPSDVRIATRIGQLSEVTLADGSGATLGPQTEVVVHFSSSERRLRLAKGEAFFAVTKDRQRPFIVEGRTAMVRVVGTHFDVKNDGPLTTISVSSGVVQVFEPGSTMLEAPLATLHRGDIALVTRLAGAKGHVTISHAANVDRFDMLTTGWRDGWLSYQDVELRRIVADLNRYYRPGVELADPTVGEMRLTASFRSVNVAQFLDSIGRLLPVTAERQSDGRYLIRQSGQVLSRKEKNYPKHP